MKMNKHYNELKASYLFVDIAHKVAAYQEAHPEKEIIRLGIGDVTQPLAKCVVDAMHDAVTEMGTKEGFHGYGPEQGYPFLKQAIQGYYAGRGTKLDEDEIFISDGAKSDCGNIGDILDVDNVIAVCDPVYPVYVDSNAMAGRAGDYDAEAERWTNIVYMPTTAENGFCPALPEGRADVIYLCSPNNPTGTVLTAEQLKVWVDYANANDAHHQTASSETGEGAYRAMAEALARSGLERVDYINAHGTATPNNDLTEGTALRRLFGEQVPPFSSTKGFTGHALAAAGGIEAVLSALAIGHGLRYGNPGFAEPIPELGLRPVAETESAAVNSVLSNSFGFGGNCSSLIFAK